MWKRLPVPTIAAIHGVAYGGGAQIALGTDIRIATPDAKLSVMEIKWGLIPDMSITQTLRDLVPIDIAKELTFSGRVLSGEEARELGLVTRTAPDRTLVTKGTTHELGKRSQRNPSPPPSGQAAGRQRRHRQTACAGKADHSRTY